VAASALIPDRSVFVLDDAGCLLVIRRTDNNRDHAQLFQLIALGRASPVAPHM